MVGPVVSQRDLQVSGTPSGCDLNTIAYRWSSLRFDHRLLSCNPSGCLVVVAILITIFSSFAHAQTAPSPWPPVPPVDWSKLKPEDFSDDELDLPYYLANFHKLANSVVETGEH